jgi:hypothetical protein
MFLRLAQLTSAVRRVVPKDTADVSLERWVSIME